jgi:hypothetical protein
MQDNIYAVNGIRTAIPAFEGLQAYVLDLTATTIGN